MKPSTQRVFDAFRKAPGRKLTTHQLCQADVGGVRFGARLNELRKLGCDIKSERGGASSFTYILRSYPPSLEVGAAIRSQSAGARGADLGGPPTPAGIEGPSSVLDQDSDPAGASSPPGSGGALFAADDFGPPPQHPLTSEEAA
jgi:hypothetical protein